VGSYSVSATGGGVVGGCTLPFGHCAASSSEMSRPTFRHVVVVFWVQCPESTKPTQHLQGHGTQIRCVGLGRKYPCLHVVAKRHHDVSVSLHVRLTLWRMMDGVTI
jgi:hypothetical protein